MEDQEFYEFSHEVKTPFTNIKGYSKLLYDEEFGKLSKEQKGYMKTIMDEADRGMLEIQKKLDTVKLNPAKLDKVYKINQILSIIRALEEKQGGAKPSEIVKEAKKSGIDKKTTMKYINELEKGKDLVVAD